MSSETEQKLVLYHLNDSRSQRIQWLLEELGIPYDIKKYKRNPDLTAPKELAEVHPFGTAPIIKDGEVTLVESGAIVEYILTKYGGGKLQPPEAGKLDNMFFTHYAEGTLMPVLVNKLIFEIVPQRAPWFLRPILRYVFGALSAQIVDPRLAVHAKFIEEHLKKGVNWFAGGEEPSAADFMMSFPLEIWAAERPGDLGDNILSYVKRVHERPAYQRALEKSGTYSYASSAQDYKGAS